jgi:hypothetical protein
VPRIIRKVAVDDEAAVERATSPTARIILTIVVVQFVVIVEFGSGKRIRVRDVLEQQRRACPETLSGDDLDVLSANIRPDADHVSLVGRDDDQGLLLNRSATGENAPRSCAVPRWTRQDNHHLRSRSS